MSAIRRRVCAWCGSTLGLLVAPSMTADTHGICAACAQAWLVTLRTRQAMKDTVRHEH